MAASNVASSGKYEWFERAVYVSCTVEQDFDAPLFWPCGNDTYYLTNVLCTPGVATSNWTWMRWAVFAGRRSVTQHTTLRQSIVSRNGANRHSRYEIIDRNRSHLVHSMRPDNWAQNEHMNTDRAVSCSLRKTRRFKRHFHMRCPAQLDAWRVAASASDSPLVSASSLTRYASHRAVQRVWKWRFTPTRTHNK